MRGRWSLNGGLFTRCLELARTLKQRGSLGQWGLGRPEQFGTCDGRNLVLIFLHTFLTHPQDAIRGATGDLLSGSNVGNLQRHGPAAFATLHARDRKAILARL